MLPERVTDDTDDCRTGRIKRIDLCRNIDHIFAGIKYSWSIGYKWEVINHSARKFFFHIREDKLCCLKSFFSKLASSLEYLIAQWVYKASLIDYASICFVILLGNHFGSLAEPIILKVFPIKTNHKNSSPI